jgi:hypothetical protein
LGLILSLPLDSFVIVLYHKYIDYSNGVSKLTFTGKGAYMSAEQEKDLTGEEEFYQTIVIGGGQAGLAVGYFLARQGENFIILDKNPSTGDVWRGRWESLRLFTPSQFDSLPGMPFPKSKNYFPPKDEVADYLEEYARRFSLPVRHNVKVESLRRNGQNYQISAGAARFTAKNVIIATGPFQAPHIPSFSVELDPGILQLHSSDYSNPKQILPKSVLVVGAGNSGAEIAIELAKAGKQVWLAGRDVGRVPETDPRARHLDDCGLVHPQGSPFRYQAVIARCHGRSADGEVPGLRVHPHFPELSVGIAASEQCRIVDHHDGVGLRPERHPSTEIGRAHV